MGRCGIRSCRFSERFKQANLQSHWLSKIGCFRQPMRLQICILKRMVILKSLHVKDFHNIFAHDVDIYFGRNIFTREMLSKFLVKAYS